MLWMLGMVKYSVYGRCEPLWMLGVVKYSVWIFQLLITCNSTAQQSGQTELLFKLITSVNAWNIVWEILDMTLTLHDILYDILYDISWHFYPLESPLYNSYTT